MNKLNCGNYLPRYAKNRSRKGAKDNSGPRRKSKLKFIKMKSCHTAQAEDQRGQINKAPVPGQRNNLKSGQVSRQGRKNKIPDTERDEVDPETQPT